MFLACSYRQIEVLCSYNCSYKSCFFLSSSCVVQRHKGWHASFPDFNLNVKEKEKKRKEKKNEIKSVVCTCMMPILFFFLFCVLLFFVNSFNSSLIMTTAILALIWQDFYVIVFWSIYILVALHITAVICMHSTSY